MSLQKGVVLNDELIRNALHAWLHKSWGVGYTFDEVGLSYRNVRLDVLQFQDGLLCGYEIKSDADDLKQLPNQVASYPYLTDINYLVVGTVLHDEAVTYLPDNWGIILATMDGNNDVHLEVERVAMLNSQMNFDELLSHCSVSAIKKEIGRVLPKSLRVSFRNALTYEMRQLIQQYMNQNILDKNFVRRVLVTEFHRNLISYKPDNF